MDDFTRGLDAEKRIPRYLPRWTMPERSEARFAFVEGGLELRIEHDQLDWRPEDAPLRVSNLQTATYSGPVGSTVGTHRHREDGLVVETDTPQRLLFTPRRGRIDVTVTASTDEGCMLAVWLVGTEHLSETDSGEICIFEIDASAIGSMTRARVGIKAHHDTRLTTDMAEVTLPFDAREPHTWTVIWGDGETIIGCDRQVVRRFGQAPDYPMALMIDLLEIGGPKGAYPKTAVIGEVTAWD